MKPFTSTKGSKSMPFGKLTVCYGNHHLSKTVNQRSKWAIFNNELLNYHLVMTNIAMENPPIFKNGTPSISIRAMASMANCES